MTHDAVKKIDEFLAKLETDFRELTFESYRTKVEDLEAKKKAEVEAKGEVFTPIETDPVKMEEELTKGYIHQIVSIVKAIETLDKHRLEIHVVQEKLCKK